MSRSRSGYHGRHNSVLQGLVSRALISLYSLSGQFPEIDGTKYGLACSQEKRLLFEADMCACNHREDKPTYRYKVYLNMAKLPYMRQVVPTSSLAPYGGMLYQGGVQTSCKRCAPKKGFLRKVRAQGGVLAKILAQGGVLAGT